MASSSSTTTSAKSIARRASAADSFSSLSSTLARLRRPAVSTSRTGLPCHSQSRLIESRVIPASGPVIIRSSPSIRLTRVDLPALGRPTIASFSGAAFVLVLVLGFDLLALDVRPERLEQVDEPFAMLGADRDRLAKAERKASSMPGLAGAALGLVGGDDHRRRLGAQPAGDLLVERGQALARVDQEQGDVGVAHRGLGLGAHPARQACAGPRPRTRRCRSPGIRGRAGCASPSRRSRVTPGPVVDQRQPLADQPVEQRRFADIGPADDGDGGKGHGGRR